MSDASLIGHLSGQLERLCGVAGLDPATAQTLLVDLLGTAGPSRVADGPVWRSDVADDHTPVEFSIAFDADGRLTVRVLGEALSSDISADTVLPVAYAFLRAQSTRFDLAMPLFERVHDLFARPNPDAPFALWHSLVFRHDGRTEFKVYFNPEIGGLEQAPDLVAEALQRLGLGDSYRGLLERMARPGELGRRDRLAFFALDLHDGPHARVKIYVSHHDAGIPDVLRAASVVDGVDPQTLADFCTTAGGGRDRFDARPLISSYTFLAGTDGPLGYSLYVPIRSYVNDDEEARGRVVALLDRHGFDSSALDRAIDAVARRPLADGLGLIPHVSLRLGPPRPGITVYLSAEAYQVGPAASAAATRPKE